MPTMMQLRSFIRNHFIHIMIYQFSAFTLLFLYLSLQVSSHKESPHLTRRKWGTCPATERCNAKFKTATLLALFLGPLGVDQFYAHNCTSPPTSAFASLPFSYLSC
ncbi:hypothetical protein BKA64DRAFT_688289 [Cadophora sp. MPI-SDFR-AT-0126]|nr:hypothetical protein BKA64DRAFT_688289 [Leotiomycetes sp. MPI-SDFR-AT-0126]